MKEKLGENSRKNKGNYTLCPTARWRPTLETFLVLYLSLYSSFSSVWWLSWLNDDWADWTWCCMCGISCWPVQVICPKCVPSQCHSYPLPDLLIGMSGKKRESLVSTVQSKYQCTINTVLVTHPKHSTARATVNILNSIRARLKNQSRILQKFRWGCVSLYLAVG